MNLTVSSRYAGLVPKWNYPGGNNFNPGGSNYNPGQYNPGGSNYNPGNYNPGGSNYNPGNSNPGGSNYNPGNSNPGGSNYNPGQYNPGGSNYNKPGFCPSRWSSGSQSGRPDYNNYQSCYYDGQCPGQMKCCNGANGMRSCEQPIFYG